MNILISLLLLFVWADEELNPIQPEPANLRWYLPITGPPLAFVGVQDKRIIVHTANSVIGVNASNGAFLYNSTIKQEFKLVKLTEKSILTVSVGDSVYFGMWDLQNGKGYLWLDLKETRVINVDILLKDYVYILLNDKIICLDHGEIKFVHQGRGYEFLEYREDLMAIGHHNNHLVFTKIDGSGKAIDDLDFQVPISTDPQFVVLGNNEFLLWIDQNRLYGLNMYSNELLDFQVFADIENFDKLKKELILIDQKTNSVIIALPDFYVLMHIFNPQDPYIEYHDLERNGKSVFIFRDENKDRPTLGRIYQLEGVYIFDLLDPTTGKLLQNYYLENKFHIKIEKGWINTFMVDLESYAFNLVVFYSQGICSFRMEDYMLDEHVYEQEYLQMVHDEL
ncbi:hypothetical protein HDV01_001938 [Terramyces sp. JEL0728]|nr:hypothetical protein HDV01_001938 [Terramyces sp. JEL0728]